MLPLRCLDTFNSTYCYTNSISISGKAKNDTGVKPGKRPDLKSMSLRDLLLIDPSITCRILTINLE